MSLRLRILYRRLSLLSQHTHTYAGEKGGERERERERERESILQGAHAKLDGLVGCAILIDSAKGTAVQGLVFIVITLIP